MSDSLYELTIDSYEQHILFAALNNHIDNVLSGAYALGDSESLLEVSKEVAACRELLVKLTKAKEIDLDDWAVREYSRKSYGLTKEKAAENSEDTAKAYSKTYKIKRNKACEQTDVICSEDECSNLTPEQVEWLQSRLKSIVESKREVIVATPPLEDINLWNNAVKVVVERHKDTLQRMSDK